MNTGQACSIQLFQPPVFHMDNRVSKRSVISLYLLPLNDFSSRNLSRHFLQQFKLLTTTSAARNFQAQLPCLWTNCLFLVFKLPCQSLTLLIFEWEQLSSLSFLSPTCFSVDVSETSSTSAVQHLYSATKALLQGSTLEPFVTQVGVFLMSQILSEMEKGGAVPALFYKWPSVLWSLNLMLFGEPGSVTPGPWGLLHGADLVTAVHQQCCDAF